MWYRRALCGRLLMWFKTRGLTQGHAEVAAQTRIKIHDFGLNAVYWAGVTSIKWEQESIVSALRGALDTVIWELCISEYSMQAQL